MKELEQITLIPAGTTIEVREQHEHIRIVGIFMALTPGLDGDQVTIQIAKKQSQPLWQLGSNTVPLDQANMTAGVGLAQSAQMDLAMIDPVTGVATWIQAGPQSGSMSLPDLWIPWSVIIVCQMTQGTVDSGVISFEREPLYVRRSDRAPRLTAAGPRVGSQRLRA